MGWWSNKSCTKQPKPQPSNDVEGRWKESSRARAEVKLVAGRIAFGMCRFTSLTFSVKFVWGESSGPDQTEVEFASSNSRKVF